MVSAIILAAGESTRMGKPKALVKFRKQSLLETVVDNFQKAGLENIIVVLGFAAEKILTKLRLPAPVKIVLNEKYSWGQFSSFQAGVRCLSSDVEGVFLALVDQPQISHHVIKKILQAYHENPNHIIIPTYRGKRGHPPIFPKILFPEILSTPPTQSASHVIGTNPDRICEIDVNDESILWNINTDKDLEEINKRFGFN